MANISYPTAGSQKVANVWNSDHALLDEGAYYVCTNPTPLTSLSTTTSVVDAGNSGATSAQTRPVAIVYNPWAVNNPLSKNIYLKYWYFFLTTAPATGTVWDMALWLEPVGANAYSTGTAALQTPVQLNPGVGDPPRAKVYVGQITANATTSAGTLICRRRMQSSIPVVLDEWLFTFGDKVMPTNLLSAGTSVKRITYSLPPVVIPPGYAVKFGMWGAANNAQPAFEYEMGFVERIPGL